MRAVRKIMSGPGGPRSQLRDLHHELPEVLAFEQADEGLGGFAEAIDDGLAALELAGPQKPADFGHELAQQVDVVGDDEALQREPALHDDEHLGWAGHRLSVLVLRDRTAKGDTAEIVQPFEHGVEDLAADILEICVDALGAELVEHRAIVA